MHSKVRFTADAVPGVEYTGVVERISDATGSAFSLIPIDNATGNFVKVEQRVTVRVKIDACDELKQLRGGYNVVCPDFIIASPKLEFQPIIGFD